jgi:hypothetical protein
MTSLGFSEYAETSNNNNEPKSNIRRNGGGGNGVRQNRTLKIPRSQELGPTNSGASNNGFSATTAGKKIKQIKDYIENIHRKGGEDSEEDPDDSSASSLLPAYPAQGMGIYASNVSHSGIIRGADTVSSNTSPVVRKTTQMNSLNPGSSYSSTLLEGMETATPTMSNIESPYFEKLTGISGAPKKDAIAAGANKPTTAPFSTNAYATHYYEQFVPYAESLANQLASSGSGGGGSGSISGTNAALIEKLNYIIHMLEEKKDEKTGHVIEELVLYCFLGIFIIFVVDTFTHAAGGSSLGGGGRGGSMFGGMLRRGAATQYYRR